MIHCLGLEWIALDCKQPPFDVIECKMGVRI